MNYDMSKIIIFGSMAADLVAKVNHFPQDGQTIIANSMETFLGGKGLNQCIAVARLSGDCEMIGCLGNDQYGQLIKNLLVQENVSSDGVFTVDDSPTGLALIQINQAGENQIVVVPAANHKFNHHHLSLVENHFLQAKYALFQLEMNLDVTYAAMKLAHQHGVKIIFNPAPAIPLSEDMLALCEVIVPNEVELGIISGMDTSSKEGMIQAAQHLLNIGAKNIVATLGSQGAMIANAQGIEFVSGFKVEQVIDTVAAGDSFNGALCVELARGATLKEAVHFANAMGALTVQVNGAIPSLHTRKEVEEFLRKESGNTK